LLLGGPYQDTERWLVADALFQDRLHAPDHPTLVAELAGEIGGVAVLTFHQTLRGWHATLDDLVIAPARQGDNLGAALVRSAIHLARVRGCTSLWATDPRDDQTRDLLVASGFAAGETLTLRLVPDRGE
jgi:GNAT superfamily N-acetyltransferase